jgi:formate-nitrite transporter family protein
MRSVFKTVRGNFIRQAELAAEAAEAAGGPGKFWEMHNMLFQDQGALTENHLVKYAETLNLDLRRFCWGLKDRAYRERVREDFRSGVMNGVYSTPSIFIDSVRHSRTFDVETLCDAVTRYIPLPRS